MSKYKKVITPIGRLLFPSLQPGSPDKYEGRGKKGAPKYVANLACDTREEFAELQAACDEVLSAFMEEAKLKAADWAIKPVVEPNTYPEKDDEGEKTGVMVEDGFSIRATMTAQYIKDDKVVKNTPARIGPDGKTPLDDSFLLEFGDKARLQVLLKPYSFDDKGYVGVRLMLAAVQLKEKGSGGGGATFGSLEEETAAPGAFEE